MRYSLSKAPRSVAGARRLFGVARGDANILDRRAVELAQTLGVSISAIEDGLCNWQKRFK